MKDGTALKSILLLAANPKSTVSLRLQEEEREIKERLRLAGYGKIPISSLEQLDQEIFNRQCWTVSRRL
jgi:hypothetical protein